MEDFLDLLCNRGRRIEYEGGKYIIMQSLPCRLESGKFMTLYLVVLEDAKYPAQIFIIPEEKTE